MSDYYKTSVDYHDAVDAHEARMRAEQAEREIDAKLPAVKFNRVRKDALNSGARYYDPRTQAEQEHDEAGDDWKSQVAELLG